MNIRYTQNKASLEQIYEILNITSNDFIPPLSARVDICDYGAKIKSKAVCFEAWDDNRLIGLVACYYNNTETYEGYLTHISLLQTYCGKGIAKQLMANCMNYGIANSFKSIRLEASKKNKKSLMFWRCLRFQQIACNGNSLYFRKYLVQ